jgi:apolipoprotein N-acyltransferase
MHKRTVRGNFVFLLYHTKWFRLALAALSGSLLFLSFPPVAFGLACYVALVPLLLAVFSSPNWKVTVVCGLITGAVFYTLSLSFMIAVFGVMGLAFANFLTLYIPLFAISVYFVAGKIGVKHTFWFIPVFWVGIEYFRAEVAVLKFPWLALGYSQSPYLWLIQICEIIGVYGVSFLIVIVNSLIAYWILERVRDNEWKILKPVVAVAIFILILIYGVFRYQYLPKYKRDSSSRTIPVVVVQDWIGSLENYIRVTHETINNPTETLVVWPESAVKEGLSNITNRTLIEGLVKDRKIYLVFGTYEPTDEVIRFNNLVVLFSPDGVLLGKYAKRVPVPFIETLVVPGDKWGIFETPLGRLGILICYEAGFSNLASWLVRKRGVEVLIVPTFEVGGWGGLPYKHHASMMPIRAVETRRPILRSAALGISMIVHPSGKVEGQLDSLASGVLRGEISKATEMTFYVNCGYIFPKLCMDIYGILLALVIVVWIIRKLPGGERLLEYIKIIPQMRRFD